MCVMRCAAVLLVLAACDHGIADPLEPTVSGSVRPALGVDPTAYSTLAARLAYTNRDADYATRDEPRPDQWPHAFTLGGGIGVSDSVDFEVELWLTNASLPDAPAPGEPSVVVPVHFELEGDSPIPIDGLLLELTP